MFKLEPCDVLLYVNEGKDIFSQISRWGIGRYEHVAMYMGIIYFDNHGVPLLYESDGRGVAIQNVQHKLGQLVLILRPKVNMDDQLQILFNATHIASDDKSYYDYQAIAWYCIPRVLKRKFPFLPIPPKYVRDKKMICSEAVAEVFWRAGIGVLPKDIVPLPGDFEKSPVLEPVYEGRLLEDIIV